MASTTHTVHSVTTTITTTEAPVVQLRAPPAERPHIRWDEKNAVDNENMGKKSSKSTRSLSRGRRSNVAFDRCGILKDDFAS